jgi:CTP synthase (UTP-ammonia lyase)
VVESVEIGILGDYDRNSPTLPSIEGAISHAAEELQLAAQARWLPTDSLLEAELDKRLAIFDGLWAAPGSPYKSFDGMLGGIEFARRKNWPFLGTCGGFQYALIECARNVLGIEDADSAENNPGAKTIIISPVGCAVPRRREDAPKLSGSVPEIRIRPGSCLHSFYGKDVVSEEFFCNYEVNPEFERAIVDAGFSIVARGEHGEIRAVESSAHAFFLATLFQPQLSSRPNHPHPIIVEFLRAARNWKTRRLEASVLEA